MAYGMNWRTTAWYMVWSDRLDSCSHVQDPFTSRRTATCMFRSHVKLLFTLGSGSKLRACEYISLFWASTLDSHNYCVLGIDQAFCES